MKEITEEHCAIIHPYLPVQRGNVRIPNIIFINALLFIAENGCKLRALPEHFGNWFTIHARMHRWAKTGVLDRLFAALREMHLIDWASRSSASTAPARRCIRTAPGLKKKTGRRASANRAADGTRRST